MECAIQPNKSQKELLETYKKTMRMILHLKDHFDFPGKKQRKSMYTDGLNNPDYEL